MKIKYNDLKHILNNKYTKIFIQKPFEKFLLQKKKINKNSSN